MAPEISTDGWHDNVTVNGSSVRPRFTHEYVQFDSKLQPKKYEIQGTSTTTHAKEIIEVIDPCN